MGKLKRLFSVLLIFTVVLNLVACKSNKSGNSSQSNKKTAVVEKKECPLLWRTTDPEGREIYFFGTIHLGDKSNKEVLNRLQPYLKKCDALAVEFDTEAYQKDISKQQSDLKMFIYEDGTTVEDHISKELYTKMKEFLKKEHKYSKYYEYLSPAFWEMIISQILAEKSGLSLKKAMDTLLIKDAYSAKRKVLEVESSDLQYHLIAGIPDEYYTVAIQSELDNSDEFPDKIKTLHSKWLKGDQEDIIKFLEQDEYENLTEEEEKLVEKYDKVMVSERNRGMAKKAMEYIESGKTVFFAVGTMHFLGDDGIVALLKKEGFKFERVYY